MVVVQVRGASAFGAMAMEDRQAAMQEDSSEEEEIRKMKVKKGEKKWRFDPKIQALLRKRKRQM